MKPKTGDIVLYRLSADDLNRMQFEASRSDAVRAVHRSNPHDVGQTVPLIVVVVWPNEHGPDFDGINGQAMIDGAGSLWVTSAKEGTEPGMWRFPTRSN